MAKIREIASGLRAPEGPVALNDGSVLVVELKGGGLTRVAPDGKKEVIAEVGGAPNGAAVGPDNKVYICNNGALIFAEISGHTLPIPGLPPSYKGGSIQRVDLASGKVETVYTECSGHPLRGPNTWSSTQLVGCGSPISARSRKGGAIEAGSITRKLTAL